MKVLPQKVHFAIYGQKSTVQKKALRLVKYCTSGYTNFPKVSKRFHNIQIYAVGQNINQYIGAFLYYCVYIVTHTKIEVFHHNCMEGGHSYMEVSTHSTIESTKKHIAVYTMYDWLNIGCLARSK